MHLPVGTSVTIAKYDPEFNGKDGIVLARHGEYYKIGLADGFILYDIYFCELEVNLK